MTPIASVKTKVSLGSLRTHQSYIDECQDISRFITINLIYCFKEMCGKSQNLIFPYNHVHLQVQIKISCMVCGVISLR